jgi:hypothetical protein
MCFSPNSSWLALTIQVFENRVNFDFTKFKIQWIRWNFGELNIHTHHSPNWMQFSVSRTKLSHNFSHLGKQTKQCQPMQEWKVPLSLCVWQEDPDFEEHPHWIFLLAKAKSSEWIWKWVLAKLVQSQKTHTQTNTHIPILFVTFNSHTWCSLSIGKIINQKSLSQTARTAWRDTWI